MMADLMTRFLVWITIGVFLLLTGMVRPALAQTTATPDYINMTVQEAAISTDDLTYITIFDNPEGVKLDKTSSPKFGKNDQIPIGTYRALRLTVTDISWHATWSVTNPSPCDETTTEGVAEGSVDLGGNTVFFFKPRELGGNTLAYYQVNPPLSGYIGDADHPFFLVSAVEVLKDSITTVNLIIGVANTLSCDSLDIYDRADGLNITFQRAMIGPATRFNGLEGVYVDTDNDEIGITNSVTNSVAIYNRTDTGDTPPLRTLIGPATRLNDPVGIVLYRDPMDSARNEIMVINRGNDSLTIYNELASDNANPLRTMVGTETGLSRPVDIALYLDPGGDSYKDEIWVANSGNDTITAYTRLAKENTRFLYHIGGGDLTGLSSPCGLYVDTDNSEIWVTNSGGDGSITIYNRNDVIESVDGNVEPIRTLQGDSTELSKPCGLYVDNDEIGVANSGDDTVRFYSRTQIIDNTDQFTKIANVAPIFTITGVNSPRDLYLDKVHNEIVVAHKGQQVVMTHQPLIFPSTTNADAASSVLAGDYNVVFYGVDIKGVNGHGFLIPVVFAERGRASFDPTTTPWPSFIFRLDTQIERQVLEPDCPVATNIGKKQTGFYGVNNDGGFYLFIPDAGGSIQGAFVPDGSAFVGSMVDSANKLLLVYGVRRTGGDAVPYLTSDGTLIGGPAHYAFTSYRNDLFFTNPPNDTEIIGYRAAIGMAETDNAAFNGVSSNGNFVTTINPMGKFEDPLSGGPSEGIENLGGPGYTSSPGGLLESPLNGLAGALTADGSTLIFVRDSTKKDTNECPTDIGFGMGLRQSPAETFSTESLNGTYLVAAFGDRFDSGNNTSLYRSSLVTITFDGAGMAQILWIENAGGMISFDRNSFTYQVNSRTVPTEGDTRLTVDVVDIFGRISTGPYASALIGEGAQSLAFFRSLAPGREANATRLLGLGLFQHP